MSEKCECCGEKIEEDGLGKLKGTIVKINEDKKNVKHYFCSSCQKKGKDKEIKK
jgi:hypothetical protein